MKITTLLFFFAIVLTSCATYTMTPEQLYTQLNSATPQHVMSHHSAGLGVQQYESNGIDVINCQDKEGHKKQLINGPSIEMRITDKNNKKHYFYFDTVLLKDSVLTGVKSRILFLKSKIKFSDIKEVEVQDGRKAYHYIN